MDLSRFFHFSLADFQGIASRRTVILVVMAVILYQGTGIFYKTMTLQLIRMRPAPAAEKKATAALQALREPVDTYRGIIDRNIFGTTTKAVAAGQGPAAPVQQDIALLIELRGTVAGEGKYGFAVVEEKATRKQRLVKAGDVLAGGKVIRIKRNALDLLVNDREQTLQIVEAKTGPIVPPAPVAAAPPSGPGGAGVISRNEIAASLQDMGSMLRQAQIRPFFNAGVPDGFMISGIQAGSPLPENGNPGRRHPPGG